MIQRVLHTKEKTHTFTPNSRRRAVSRPNWTKPFTGKKSRISSLQFVFSAVWPKVIWFTEFAQGNVERMRGRWEDREGGGGRHQNWLHFDDVTASEKPNFLDGPQQNKLINWSVNRSSIHQKKKICDLIIALRNWGKRFMLSTESSAEGKQQK